MSDVRLNTPFLVKTPGHRESLASDRTGTACGVGRKGGACSWEALFSAAPPPPFSGGGCFHWACSPRSLDDAGRSATATVGVYSNFVPPLQSRRRADAFQGPTGCRPSQPADAGCFEPWPEWSQARDHNSLDLGSGHMAGRPEVMLSFEFKWI